MVLGSTTVVARFSLLFLWMCASSDSRLTELPPSSIVEVEVALGASVSIGLFSLEKAWRPQRTVFQIQLERSLCLEAASTATASLFILISWLLPFSRGCGSSRESCFSPKDLSKNTVSWPIWSFKLLLWRPICVECIFQIFKNGFVPPNTSLRAKLRRREHLRNYWIFFWLFEALLFPDWN